MEHTTSGICMAAEEWHLLRIKFSKEKKKRIQWNRNRNKVRGKDSQDNADGSASFFFAPQVG
jgi:hypothetical protein